MSTCSAGAKSTALLSGQGTSRSGGDWQLPITTRVGHRFFAGDSWWGASRGRGVVVNVDNLMIGSQTMMGGSSPILFKSIDVL